MAKSCHCLYRCSDYAWVKVSHFILVNSEKFKMITDLKTGDYVETIIASHGEEYRIRGRVVYAASDIVVVTLKSPMSRKPSGTPPETLRYSIGLMERGHECAEVFAISYNQFLVLWNL